MKVQAMKDQAELDKFVEKLIRSEAGTIGHDHYLILMRRYDEIMEKIDGIFAIFAVQDDQRRRDDLHINELRKRIETIEQQCLHRTATSESRQNAFENQLERIDRRLYALQQEMITKPPSIFQPLMRNTNLGTESDISESGSSSRSPEIRSKSSSENSSKIINDALELQSPERLRDFYRRQGLDVDAKPFQMPIPAQPIIKTSSEFCRAGSISHKKDSNRRLYNQGKSKLSHLNNHQDNRRVDYKRPPSSGFEPRAAAAGEPQTNRCVNYVQAMCTELYIRSLEQIRQVYGKRPSPRQLQPMSIVW